LLLSSTALMLLIIIPVMIAVIVISWRYRASNTSARYQPEWAHSTQLELLIWSAPLLIVIALGALTWLGTHTMDPFRPISRIAPGRPLQSEVKPLEVDVVALDWKWLFIYPEYNVAAVNELAAPVDRPIAFKIGSATVMNAFYIPALAGMIYAMPGMETALHAVINQPGDFEGFSANYSGLGFSGMRFRFHGMNNADFDSWIGRLRVGKDSLDRQTYLDLERPSFNVPVRYFHDVAPDLFHAIVNMCVASDKMCADDMREIDRKGGLGVASRDLIWPLAHDKAVKFGTVLGGPANYVEALCGFTLTLPENKTAIEMRRVVAGTSSGVPTIPPVSVGTGGL
jgi:cytochrome o ubiquinol oxidase subunit 2